MNRHQKRSQKAILRRAERQQAKSGKPQNPIQELNDRLARIEAAVNSNLGVLFRNHQQLKHGLDAAEVNQRAMVKVVQDLCKGLGIAWPTDLSGTKPKYEHTKEDVVFPVSMLVDGIDWGKYYRAAEDDILAEQIASYKTEIAKLVEKADSIDADLPMFEAGLDKELEDAGVVTKEHPRAQAVYRFLGDLRTEIAKIRAAAEAIAKDEVTKEKMAEINIRIIQDATHMISVQKNKKEAADKASKVGKLVEPPASEDPNTVTQEFGG